MLIYEGSKFLVFEQGRDICIRRNGHEKQVLRVRNPDDAGAALHCLLAPFFGSLATHLFPQFTNGSLIGLLVFLGP